MYYDLHIHSALSPCSDDTMTIYNIFHMAYIKGLDLIEFDRLKDIRLIALYHCYQGCIGGYYLWNNPFEGRFHIESMLNDCLENHLILSEDEYLKKRQINVQKQSIQERMK